MPAPVASAFQGSPAGADANAIITACLPLVRGAWVHWSEDRRRVAIELWWYKPPTPEQETECARLAAAAFLETHGTTRADYEALRVLRGREKPQAGKRRLPPLVP